MHACGEVFFSSPTSAPVAAAASDKLPPLSAPQLQKLRQLTVVTLAESSKFLDYDLLCRELDVSSTRALEDLIINDCIYAVCLRLRSLRESI